MRARYPWTHPLDHILSLISGIGDNEISPEDRLNMLEILGGLEMDAWIVGRRSKVTHIWATYCRGGGGIEQFTGLPRPLLDLISRTSQGEEVTEELRGFMQTLPDTCTDQVKFWQCFALAAILELRERHPTCAEDDTRSIKRDLAIVLRELHFGTRLQPSSALAWPAYTLGRLTRCPEKIQLVEDVLSDASQLYEIRGQWTDQGTPLGAMRTYWHKNGVQLRLGETGNSEAASLRPTFEIGLW